VIGALMSVTIHRTRKGRPPGWKRGQSYFDPTTIEITPKA
jgi:site-specific DNA recombinase